mgnify:CR=1 FL=1|tara:strand:+ start:1534 stop:3144 length:1611 start_codon:yes stop_codon:yes gene_type:complete
MEDVVKQDLIDAFSGNTSIEEQTTSSDAGAYVTPQVWAKNSDNWRALKDPNFPMYGGPGGKFVKIKDKCKTFPYCNQGDINALDFYDKPKKKRKSKKIKLTPLGVRKRKIAKDLVKNQRIKTPRGKHYNIGRRISEDTGYLYYNSELTEKEVEKAILENTMKNKIKHKIMGKSLEESVRKTLINEIELYPDWTDPELEDCCDLEIDLGTNELETSCCNNGGSGQYSNDGETYMAPRNRYSLYDMGKEKENKMMKRQTQNHGYGCSCGDGNYDKTCCDTLQEQEKHQAQKLYDKLDAEQGISNVEGIKLAAEKIKKFMTDDKGDSIEPPMYRNNKTQDEFVEDVYYSSGQTGIEYDQPLTDTQKKRHADYLKGSIETGNNTGKGSDGQQVANITMTNAEGGANNAGEMLAKAAERRSKNLAKGNKMANNDRRYSPDVQATTSAKDLKEDVVTIREHVIDTPEQILKLSPNVYKIEGREWTITNGIQTKKVRYESFIGGEGGTVVILKEENRQALSEEVKRMKRMFRHNSNTRHDKFL